MSIEVNDTLWAWGKLQITPLSMTIVGMAIKYAQLNMHS